MRFYLGTHQPHWLGTAGVPLFVSARRLRDRKSWPKAAAPWALDSGGFSELSLHGRWVTAPEDYVREARRWRQEIGGMDWAAAQDWMCEPWILEKTGLTVERHQRTSVENYLLLTRLAPEMPWAPVVQGWAFDDYLRHVGMYADAGVNLAALPVVGLGSVCRRQDTGMVEGLIRDLHGRGLRVHGFGFKLKGLRKVAPYLASADSMAWSFAARRQPPHAWLHAPQLRELCAVRPGVARARRPTGRETGSAPTHPVRLSGGLVMSAVLVSLSGGLDSTTLLALALREHAPAWVRAAFFRYPSKHNAREEAAARAVAEAHGVPLRVLDASGLFADFCSALLSGGGELPSGHYTDESMRQTVVPCRNLIFLSALAGLCDSDGGGEVWLGMHAGDACVYPDCRPAFVSAADACVRAATEDRVTLTAPLVGMDKAAVLRLARELKAPLHLTRTCYAEDAAACGVCGACQSRLAAFAEVGAEDPLEYRGRVLLPPGVPS